MALDWAYIWGNQGKNGLGSRSTGEQVTEGIRLSGCVALITGATSGVGLETARVLALRGARLVIPGRSLEAAERAKCCILADVANAEIYTGILDLGSLASVRRFVQDFQSLNIPLHILINNAGVLCGGLQLSNDDMELHFATNHLGHFLLTNLLLDKMVSTSENSGIEGRIINVSSKEHAKALDGIQFDKLCDESSLSDPHPTKYAVSKLANILHAKELARRLKEKGAQVTANAVHPGVVYTGIMRHLSPGISRYLRVCSLLMRSVAQGAATTCYVAAHPSLNGCSGKYYADCNEASCSSYANNMELAKQLWDFSEVFVSKSEG